MRVDAEFDPSIVEQLFEMLAETQMRLNDLDARLPPPLSRENTDTLGADDEVAEAQARAALHNLLFPNLPMDLPFFVDQHGNPHTSHHLGSSRNPSNAKTPAERPDAADARSLAEMPEWGSSVEIPDGDSTVPPPQFSPALPPKDGRSMPTIHIQPPTTTASNSQGGTHHGQAHAAPGAYEQKAITLLDVAETVPSVTERAKSVANAPLSVKTMCQPPVYHETNERLQENTRAHAVQARPWDIVSQRLLSWALVWPAEDFVRSLEGIARSHQVRVIHCHRIARYLTLALLSQVDEFSLTIYTMTILKR